jgi:dTDP-4-dehydrorhamnose reductase
MKILLLGKNGQVGWELQRSLAVLGHVVALDRQGDGPLVGNLQDLAGLARTVHAVRPDVIVNAAAYTAVDKAESEPDVARAINAEAPGVLAREAAHVGAWLVHYSTDYVFDGSGTAPWAEDAPTGPLSVYGSTKLAGEHAIRASGCQHLIFRTSWVYAARGNNFAKTMLRVAKERDDLRVVADQVGAPTGAELLADATAHAVRTARGNAGLSGTYHVAAAGETSWWEYARFVIEHARAAGAPIRVAPDAVLPIRTVDYPTPAARPLNSRLATGNFTQTFGLRLPPWREGVARMNTEGHT